MSRRTLTIILGETRSHELTWERFKTNVLDELGSDLAVCVGQDLGLGQGSGQDPFTKNSKYVWTYPEQPKTDDGWAEAFTKDVCGGSEDWKILTGLRDQLFGGLCKEHKGSAGILLFFRWFLREKLIETGVVNDYDYFIITRSDYYWVSPHPKCVDSIYLPEGESYGGLSDRHMVIPRKHVLKALDVCYRFVNSTQKTFDTMCTHDSWNLEKYLAFHFVCEGIYDHVKWFPRNVYAVRSDTAPTRWAEGYFEPGVNMIVKYQSEYEIAKKIQLELINPHAIIDSRNTCSKYQIPDLAMPLMVYEKHEWSKELVDTLVDAASKRIDFSPRDYPFSVVDFYKAFDEFPVRDKKTMVAGSISPWNEAILLAHDAKEVHTYDYTKIYVEDRLSTFVVGKDDEGERDYDVVCSFSSVEHDGLGRYGDPIDPNGDFRCMREFNEKLKDGGLLFLGIPVCGSRGVIEGNCHRIYSKERFEAMLEYSGFTFEKIIDDHWGWNCENINWQNQPIFVLSKKTRQGSVSV